MCARNFPRRFARELPYFVMYLLGASTGRPSRWQMAGYILCAQGLYTVCAMLRNFSFMLIPDSISFHNLLQLLAASCVSLALVSVGWLIAAIASSGHVGSWCICSEFRCSPAQHLVRFGHLIRAERDTRASFYSEHKKAIFLSLTIFCKAHRLEVP